MNIQEDKYNGFNMKNARYKGRNLTVDGTVVTFEVAHVNSNIYNKVSFDVSAGFSKKIGSTLYYTPTTESYVKEGWLVGDNKIEYVCVQNDYEGSGLPKIELNFVNGSHDWDVQFSDHASLQNLGKVPEPGVINTNTGNADGTSSGGAGGAASGGAAAGVGFDRRVYKMQVMLNDAGYTDGENKPLDEDGLLGPKTRAAAQKAGIDPETWNGTPRIKPNETNNNTNSDANTNGNTEANTMNTETFENNKAYGRFLGGADKAEIFAFQKKFGVEPTGIYDEATAEKAYELALDAQSEFTQAGRTIKAWAEKYGSYSSGDQAGYQRAQSEFKTQQMAQAVETSLESLNSALDAYMKGNPAANKRIMYIKNQIAKADFEDAKAKAGVLAQIGKRNQILQLIDAYEKAYMAQQASRQQAVNEIKTNFFSVLERINNATILQ